VALGLANAPLLNQLANKRLDIDDAVFNVPMATVDVVWKLLAYA
jgi:hypothetical protein